MTNENYYAFMELLVFAPDESELQRVSVLIRQHEPNEAQRESLLKTYNNTFERISYIRDVVKRIWEKHGLNTEHINKKGKHYEILQKS